MNIDELIKEIQNVDSSFRIGQIICNALNITCPELYYVKDDKLLEDIELFYKPYLKLTGDQND